MLTIHIRYVFLLMAVVTASVTMACGSSDTRRAETFTTSDSSGVQIIVNHLVSRTEPGWILDSLPATTIGNNSLDSNQQFRRMPAAVRLTNGNIIVAEEGRVSAFDSTGSHVKTLVRRGGGPGELQRVSQMIVLKADTLVVKGNRIMKFSAAAGGSLVSEERLECPSAPRVWQLSAYCLAFYADGSAVTILSDSTIPRTATNRPDIVFADNSSSPGPGHLRQFYRIFIVPPQRDTAYPTGLWAGIEQFGIPVSPGNENFVIHPFYSRSSYMSYGGTPGRLAVALNPEYNIEIWSDRGKLERLIRRTNARRTPTEAEKLEARKFIETQLEGSTITVDRALAEITVPDSLPAFAGLTMGPGGELLVQTGGWHSADSATVINVFDPHGVWVAEWKLPRRARVLEMGSDYILTARLGDDDVPLVELRYFRTR